jgi:YidC/Oxa1 family membrane protein insertase
LWSSDFGGNATWLQGFGLFLIPLISGARAFLASRISTKMNPAADAGPQGGSMKSMMLMMPLISIYIAYIMPAALGIYWIARTFFGIIQDIWLTKRYKKIMDAEDASLVRKRSKRRSLRPSAMRRNV